MVLALLGIIDEIKESAVLDNLNPEQISEQYLHYKCWTRTHINLLTVKEEETPYV